MYSDTRWRRHLTHALDANLPIDCGPFVSAHRNGAATVKSNSSEENRATENILAWRAYLPDACVAAMVNDGWQWTT